MYNNVNVKMYLCLHQGLHHIFSSSLLPCLGYQHVYSAPPSRLTSASSKLIQMHPSSVCRNLESYLQIDVHTKVESDTPFIITFLRKVLIFFKSLFHFAAAELSSPLA